ncbi:MAG: MoxR family ATPase [Chloroherpetonaceae bacterium]
MTEAELHALLEKIPALKREIEKVIIGQSEVLDELLIAFIAGGHALLEGVPGLAKTLMIRSLANAVSLSFRRIQFTPDLMPSDILGTEVLEEDRTSGKRFFKFNRGPIFANIVLADEINRTPPKTQSALLEAMQEFSVTQAGNTYPLEKPFFVLATQNPIEQAGTYPLPEAQLDRFMLYIKLGYPSEEGELNVLLQTTGTALAQITPVLSGEELLTIQRLVREVVISTDLMKRVNLLVRETRPQTTSQAFIKENVEWGAGTRAAQALILSAKARALMQGRFSVLPDDIERVAFAVLRHRILLNFKAQAEKRTPDDVIEELLSYWRIER